MRKLFYFYLVFYFFLLSYLASNLYISPREALIFYQENSLLHFITNFSCSIFGKNDLSFRIVFIFINLLNVLLFLKLCLKVLKKEEDALLATLIFSMLPGFISSSVVVTKVSIVLFLTLIFLNIKEKKISILLFPLMLFVDRSFAIFFLSIFFYSLYKKDNFTSIISLVFFALSMLIFGFNAEGKPKNYFLDTFAVYSAIFSPLVFIYFFYVLYRILVKGKKDIIWFISFVAFIFSLILSFRQKISFEDFAPFALVGVVLMVREFMSSYKVRLPEFRKKYKLVFLIVVGSLVLNDLALVFNKSLYIFLDNPKKHFAYNFDISRELAKKLKSMNINCINTNDKKLQYQLKFYNVKKCDKYILTAQKIYPISKKVSILYKNIVLKSYFVSKINNK